jgi:hypothetical protein
MGSFVKKLFSICFALVLAGCHSQYPEGMSRVERKKYYDDYNKAYTDKNLAAAPVADASVQTAKAVTDMGEASTSVPFSIRNNSLLPQKIEINGNVLKFNPLEVRYIGFAAGAKAYLYDKSRAGGKGRFLFEVGEDYRDKQLKLFD